MRRRLLWFSAVLPLSTTTTLAQGVVNFNNNVLSAPPDRLVRFPDGSPVTGTNYVTQLYWSTDGVSFTASSSGPARFRPAGVSPAGTWLGGNRTLPAGVGGIGNSIQLKVRAWDVLTGRDGESAPFVYVQRLSAPPKAEDTYMDNFQGFTIGPCTGAVAIVSQPVGQTVPAGTNVLFSIGLSNFCNATIQWQFNTTNIFGQVFPQLLITNVRPHHAGEYRAIVSNNTAIVTSTVAALVVTGPYIRLLRPTINETFVGPTNVLIELEFVDIPGQVTNVTYQIGDTVVGTSEMPPFNLVVSNLTLGDYSLLATAYSDTGQSFLSDWVFFRVMEPPSATIEPLQQIALVGSSPQFSAVTAGSQPIWLQWRFESVPLEGQNLSTLVLTHATIAMSGSYSVIATNAVGSFTSIPVLLKVRPVIVLIDGHPVHTPGYTSSVPMSVTLETSYPRGTIFYTLDGSTPNFGSSQYAGAFTVSRSKLLRAVGYSADFFESGECEPVLLVKVSPPPLRSLTVSSAGGGTIAVSPSKSAYLDRETIQVTAQAEASWSFLEWRGAVTGTNPVAILEMNSDKCVSAIFATTLSTTVAGNGAIVPDPASNLYPYGTLVRLYAVPAISNYFVTWGNYGSGSQNPLAFSMTVPNPAVSSAFFPVGSNQVTLTAVPDGLGLIEMTPATNRYALGQIVTLRARPESGQTFLYWSGDATGKEPTIPVTLDRSKVVTGHFSKTPHLIAGPCQMGIGATGFYGTFSGAWNTPYTIYSGDLFTFHAFLTATNPYGTFQFTDSDSTNLTGRFFRVKHTP
jgi:hypothetical protein